MSSRLVVDAKLLDQVSDIAERAAVVIMKIYEQADHGVQTKSDESPLTLADLAAQKVILAGLKKLTPDVPIVSEESSEADNQEAMKSNYYWLVDPVDGTKEFIKRNGEFTVNIALIEGERPVLGVVGVPAQDLIYAGEDSLGARKRTSGGPWQDIQVSDNQELTSIAVSRSHLDPVSESIINELDPKPKVISAGSALKLCLVAEGSADVYLRLGGSMEWDIAAGDALVRAAGGKILAIDGELLKYHKLELLNPHFVCYNGKINIEEILRKGQQK